MGRLINIDRLCNDLMERWSIADKKKEDTIRAVMADVVTPIVASQPTVDAVPVVRCKNCIHWGKYPVSTVLPQYHKCGMATYKSTKGDDFCSDGKDSDPEPLKGGKNMCGYKIFSKRLKEQLNKKGMTQKELAEKIGTTEASVSRYVSGQRIPKASVVFKIATAIGVSTDYLLGMEEKEGDHAEGAIQKERT